MTAITYHKTKDSVVTIGSTAEQSRITSDIAISGAEKSQTSIEAIDGTNYAFAGLAGSATVEFDFLAGRDFNIEEMVYGPDTTSGSPTEHSLNWGGTGEDKTITISNVRTSNNQTVTVTLTDVSGISCPITLTKGDAVYRRFSGVVSASNIAETLVEGS